MPCDSTLRSQCAYRRDCGDVVYGSRVSTGQSRVTRGWQTTDSVSCDGALGVWVVRHRTIDLASADTAVAAVVVVACVTVVVLVGPWQQH